LTIAISLRLLALWRSGSHVVATIAVLIASGIIRG
jgi:hypothetical protein